METPPYWSPDDPVQEVIQGSTPLATGRLHIPNSRTKRIGSTSTGFHPFLFRNHREVGFEFPMAVILLLSIVVFTGALLYEHQTIQDEFDGIFRPALGLESSVSHLDRDLMLVRLARQVEKELCRLADGVQAAWLSTPPTEVRLRRPEPPPISDSVAQQVASRWPMPLNSPGSSFRRDPSYANQLITQRGQYKVFYLRQHPQQNEHDSLVVEQVGRDASGPDDGTKARAPFYLSTELIPDLPLRSRIIRVRDSLAVSYPHFPDTSASPVAGPRHAACAPDADRTVAFLYAALRIPAFSSLTDPGDSTLTQRTAEWWQYCDRLGDFSRQLRLQAEDPGEVYQPSQSDSLWLAATYAYIEVPGSPLPSNYDPVKRNWFAKAIRSHETVWSAQYGDIGTGLPVVTASLAVRDGQEQPVGVVSADLHASALIQSDLSGRPILLNLYFLFGICLVLLGILYASGMWKDFAALYFAVFSMYAVYLVLGFEWVFYAHLERFERAIRNLDTVVSLLNSSLFILSTVMVFDQLDRRQSLLSLVFQRTRHFLARHPDISPFFLATASSVTVWILVYTLNSLFPALSPAGNGSIPLERWVDAMISFAALSLFGYRFAVWCNGFVRFRILAPVLVGVFIIYGALQIPYPFLRPNAWYIWALFYGKVLIMSIIVAAVFSYTQNYNYSRRQLAKIATKVFSRSLNTTFLVFGAKLGRNVSPVIFLNETACRRVGLNPIKIEPPTLRRHKKRSKSQSVERMARRSIFGDRFFYEPLVEIPVQELFAEGEFHRIQALLDGQLAERGLVILRNLPVELRDRDGTAFRCFFHTLTRWPDRFLGTKRWEHYLVGVASTEDAGFLRKSVWKGHAS